jgi:hypothetical protein
MGLSDVPLEPELTDERFTSKTKANIAVEMYATSGKEAFEAYPANVTITEPRAEKRLIQRFATGCWSGLKLSTTDARRARDTGCVEIFMVQIAIPATTRPRAAS